jgi:hypothetical protein
MNFYQSRQYRLPRAVTVQTAQGEANCLLGYDQVGSLKVVAAMDGESEGRVVEVRTGAGGVMPAGSAAPTPGSAAA